MRSKRQRIGRLLASSFGVGFVPILPGTLASALGVLLYLFVGHSIFLYLTTVFIIFWVGVLSSRSALQTTEEKDPSWIVIDEVLGMMITLFQIPPRVPFLVLGFVLFRFFDSIKIPPIDRLEHLKGEWGILLDDVGAGIYATLLLQLILRFAS